MPATSLTKVTASKYGVGVADMGFESADAGNNNDFANTGKERVVIKNGSGGPLTVTIPNAPGIGDDTYTKTPNGPIADGDQGYYGPFPTKHYGDTVELAYSTGTSVEVAVIEEEDTP